MKRLLARVATRQTASSLLELAGAACLVAACAVLAPWLGLAAAGATLFLVGTAVGE